MKILAIKGNQRRGAEVIRLLKMLGGKNEKYYHDGTWEIDDLAYIVDENNDICVVHITDNLKVYNLDTFYNIYPFKVGDKAFYYNSQIIVDKIEWNGHKILYSFVLNGECHTVSYDLLRECEMEKPVIRYKIPQGYDFDKVENDEVILRKVELAK